ncbi:F-box protein PP2-B15-like [Hevea brasiliensis]|uniref:F-box protein PP2-B15-like n=1 Tax=Hevea brasiliensis TaxID=3981 RepID=UPI0025DBAE05|nr:F-box protein PP2-B15-like [Hevea brasiliensis]
MNLDLLPEDCFAHILSFTSPRDACCTSVVSSVVRSLADLDTVWEKFLPSDYPEILSRIVSPMTCSSKKELFLRLCNPHLIDDGRKIISLEKSTGKKSYVLSSRELSISWATNPLYWSWKPHQQSRFREVVELRTICWLQINGKFNTQMLSPRTDYGVYLIFKFADRAHGLDTLPSEVSVQVGNFKTQGKVYLRRQDKSKQAVESVCFLNRMTAPRSRTQGRDGSTSYSSAPCDREDGWTEIELGSFYNQGGANTEVEMGLKEVTGEHLKGGLIVEGIEIRPNS